MNANSHLATNNICHTISNKQTNHRNNRPTHNATSFSLILLFIQTVCAISTLFQLEIKCWDFRSFQYNNLCGVNWLHTAFKCHVMCVTESIVCAIAIAITIGVLFVFTLEKYQDENLCECPFWANIYHSTMYKMHCDWCQCVVRRSLLALCEIHTFRQFCLVWMIFTRLFNGDICRGWWTHCERSVRSFARFTCNWTSLWTEDSLCGWIDGWIGLPPLPLLPLLMLLFALTHAITFSDRAFSHSLFGRVARCTQLYTVVFPAVTHIFRPRFHIHWGKTRERDDIETQRIAKQSRFIILSDDWIYYITIASQWRTEGVILRNRPKHSFVDKYILIQSVCDCSALLFVVVWMNYFAWNCEIPKKNSQFFFLFSSSSKFLTTRKEIFNAFLSAIVTPQS